VKLGQELICFIEIKMQSLEKKERYKVRRRKKNFKIREI